jgi:prevent-host-death family protein
VSHDPRIIPQRELRNEVGRVLRDVEAGETVRVTVRGRPVADLVPLDPRPSRFVATRAAFAALRPLARPLLREELAGDDELLGFLDEL